MSRCLTSGWLLLLLLAVACSSSTSSPSGSDGCRAVGTESGVSVYFEKGTLPSSGDVAITACVDDACRTHVAKAAESNPFIPVLPTPPDKSVQVRIKVLSGNGAKLFDASTPAHTKVIEQSGKHCTSPAAQVSVIAHRDGTLGVAP